MQTIWQENPTDYLIILKSQRVLVQSKKKMQFLKFWARIRYGNSLSFSMCKIPILRIKFYIFTT